MNPLSLLLGNWRALAIGLAVGAVAGSGGTWWLRDQMAARTQLQAARTITRTVVRQGEATERVVYRTVEAQERVRTVTRTIIRDIPHVLPVETDRSFPLPVGLIRLHDAAALGTNPVPDPAGRADDAASPVAASDLANAFADNYGACRLNSEQLVGLQSWVTEQERVSRQR